MLSVTKVSLNTTWIATIDLLIKISSYVFLLFLARKISINDFGLYHFVISFTYFFAIISDFGTQFLLERNIAENNYSILKTALTTRLYMSIFAIILCIVIVYFLAVPENTKFLIFVYAFSLFPKAIYETVLPIFRGMENFFYERLFLLIKNIFFLVIAVTVVYITKNILFLVLTFVFSELIGAIAAFYLFNKTSLNIKIIPFSLKSFDFSFLKKSLPFVAGAGLYVFYFRIDSIMLKLLKSDFELGIYSSAYRIYEALLFIPSAIGTAIFPRLIKIEKENYYSAVDKVMKVTLLISSIISILVIYYSSYIPLLYGHLAYQALTKPLKVIFIIAPIAFVNYFYIILAFVQKKETKILLPLLLVAAINVIANFYFIPKYGYMGAAWTTNISEVLLFILINCFVLSKVTKKIGVTIKFYFAFISSLSFLYLMSYSIFLPFLALFIFALLLYILKVFNFDDVIIFKKIFSDIISLIRGSKDKDMAEN